MLKKCLCLLLSAVLLVSLLPLPARGESVKKVTVMIYMCGSDLEMKNFEGTGDLKDIGSAVNRDAVHTVALLGGSPVWAGGYDTSKLTLVELGGRRPKAVDSFDGRSMGEADTLTFFLELCRNRYPADRYILIIWDHGGGPNGGVCYDMLYGRDCLTVNELASALGSSCFAGDGLDLIAFNTCLTGSVEYAANLAPYARYMVATEDSMFGLNYDFLKTVDTDETILDTARHLVDATFAFNQDVINRQEEMEINAVSLFDLSGMDSVVQSMDGFFSRVTPSLDLEGFVQVSQERGNTTTFGSTTSNGVSNYDLADLGDLARHLRAYAPEEADRLLSAVSDAVLYHRSAVEATTGMTVYHPYSNKGNLETLMAAHNDIPLSEAYSAYIQQFAAQLTNRPMADFSNLHASASVSKDTRTLFTLILSESQASHLASSRFQVLHRQPDGSWRMVYDSPRTDLNGLQITGEYNGSALAAVKHGEEREAVSPLITYERREDGKILIPAFLTRSGQADLPDFSSEALIVCAEGDDRNLLPGEVLLWDEVSGGYTGIFGMSFRDFTEISLPLVSRAETGYADLDALLPFTEWDVVSREEWTAPIDGSWGFGFLMDALPPEELAAAFQVTDVQYNLYTSSLEPLKAKSAAGTMYVDYDDLNLALISQFNIVSLGDSLMITADLTNLTDREVLIQAADVTVGGNPFSAEAVVYGTGDNWGLLPGEKQILQLSLPRSGLADQKTITGITFSLNLLDAADDSVIIGTVPVQVTMMMQLK